MTDNSNCSTVHMVTLHLLVDLRFYSDRKYFIALIIRCRKHFECLIFGHHCASEIFLTPKFPQTTVHVQLRYGNVLVMPTVDIK